MRKNYSIITLVVFLFFCSSSIFAQNYINYQRWIGRAEQAILDSNYTEAVTIYDSIFNNYSFVFAENCYTATQTAIVAQKFDKAFYFMRRGFQQGLTSGMIDKDSLLVELKTQSKWQDLMNDYDSLRNIYKSNINQNLRHCIDSLNTLDQKWRNKHEMHPWNFLWRPFIWHKWKKVTKHIVEDTLIQIIKKYGYPSERIIGLLKDTLHNGKIYYGSSNPACLTIFKHYFSIPRNVQVNTLLKKQVEKGFLNPRDFATIVDYEVKWGKQKYYKGLPYFQYFQHFPNDYSTKIDTINKNRTAIGLGTIGFSKKVWDRGMKIRKLQQQENYRHIYLFRTYYDSL